MSDNSCDSCNIHNIGHVHASERRYTSSVFLLRVTHTMGYSQK